MPKHASLSLRGIAVLCLIALAGCAGNQVSRSGEKIAAGTAVGAVTGTAITVATGGCVPCGAAIGGAAGAGAGYFYHWLNRTPGR